MTSKNKPSNASPSTEKVIAKALYWKKNSHNEGLQVARVKYLNFSNNVLYVSRKGFKFMFNISMFRKN